MLLSLSRSCRALQLLLSQEAGSGQVLHFLSLFASQICGQVNSCSKFHSVCVHSQWGWQGGKVTVRVKACFDPLDGS